MSSVPPWAPLYAQFGMPMNYYPYQHGIPSQQNMPVDNRFSNSLSYNSQPSNHTSPDVYYSRVPSKGYTHYQATRKTQPHDPNQNPHTSSRTARIQEEKMVNVASFRDVLAYAPVWVSISACNPDDPLKQTVLPDSALIALFQQSPLVGSTLLVGLTSEALDHTKPLSPIPPSFFRPLLYLIALVQSGQRYNPVTRMDIDNGFPPPFWCIPSCLVTPTKKNLYQTASKSKAASFQKSRESADTSAADDAPNLQGILATSPFWCAVTIFNQTGQWKCPTNMSVKDMQRHLESGTVSLYTPVLGLTSRKNPVLWLPTALMLPLGALVDFWRSGVMYKPMKLYELDVHNGDPSLCGLLYHPPLDQQQLYSKSPIAAKDGANKRLNVNAQSWQPSSENEGSILPVPIPVLNSAPGMTVWQGTSSGGMEVESVEGGDNQLRPMHIESSALAQSLPQGSHWMVHTQPDGSIVLLPVPTEV